MGSIYSILWGVGALACFIFYIMAIVKAFKAGDTLWGVLNIFIGICGLIYLFMKGHKQLGIYYVIAIIVCVVAGVLGGNAFATMIPTPAVGG